MQHGQNILVPIKEPAWIFHENDHVYVTVSRLRSAGERPE